MALGRSRRAGRKFIAPKIQITAMMDMFTIIMIFLLVSFSSKPERMNLDKTIDLPQSVAQQDYTKNIKLILTQTDLRLEEEVVASVQDGQIDGLDPAKIKDSKLYAMLRTYREEADRSKEQMGEAFEVKEHVLFFCDKRHSFKTVNAVMKAAGMAGYPNVQFAVLEK